jgi:Putative zinc-finger
MGEDRTNGRCDQGALVQLLDGALSGSARRAALAHLEGCEACQQQARWLGRVEELLGPLHEGHPASSKLSAYAAGELSAEQRSALAAHLQGCEACRGLERAAAAGLAEAELVEHSLALLEQRTAAAGEVPLMIPELHLPFAVAVAPQAPALAADSAAAPLPRDRRVLLEEPGSLRLVYYRLAGQAQISLFAQGSAAPELELEATLDDAPLSPARDEEGNISLDLGPAVRLPGRTLRLVLGQGQRTLAWTFVEEEDDDAER